MTPLLLLAGLLGLALAASCRLTGTAFTDYSAGKVIDSLLRNTAYTPASTVYLALYTATPSDSSAGTEVSGGGYARRPITFDAASGSPRQTANSGSVVFPASGTASANWGTITHFAIMDASTSGNMLLYGALDSPQIVNSGGTITFGAGTVIIKVD